MRVLVTGAGGFLGRYALGALRRRGLEVITAGRRRPLEGQASGHLEVDLLAEPDWTALWRASGATHLLHLAWYVEHGEYWNSGLNLRWVDATTRLVEACCQSGCQGMVLAGSCAEYDWSQGTCREDSTPLRPASLYGTCKDATRRLSAALCAQHRIPCAWGRIFLPFGSGEDRRRLVPSLIEVFRGTRSPFHIEASASRDFLHASDVAEGFLTLLLRQASGEFNISSGEPVQVGTLASELARLLGADPRPVLALSPAQPAGPPLLLGENRKLTDLGWQPRLSLTQGLELTVRGSQP
jgi:nucleoside-diphosphate-sugar epimerase